jgi:hypothetical protein
MGGNGVQLPLKGVLGGSGLWGAFSAPVLVLVAGTGLVARFPEDPERGILGVAKQAFLDCLGDDRLVSDLSFLVHYGEDGFKVHVSGNRWRGRVGVLRFLREYRNMGGKIALA